LLVVSTRSPVSQDFFVVTVATQTAAAAAAADARHAIRLRSPNIIRRQRRSRVAEVEVFALLVADGYRQQ
jgi:hypothetical protein